MHELVTVRTTFAIPVSFDGFSCCLILEPSLGSVSVENAKLGLVHCVGVWLILYSVPNPVQLCRKHPLYLSIQGVGLVVMCLL